jgi:hypothetical protein
LPQDHTTRVPPLEAASWQRRAGELTASVEGLRIRIEGWGAFTYCIRVGDELLPETYASEEAARLAAEELISIAGEEIV